MEEKKIKGRKRHIVVDTQGHLLKVFVHAANIHDTNGGVKVIEETLKTYPSLKAFSGDAGYRKTCKEFVEKTLNDKEFHVSEKIKYKWVVLPFRWVVERAFAHQQNSRRLSKDYENTCFSAENMVKIASIQLMLKRRFSQPVKMFLNQKPRPLTKDPPYDWLQEI